MAGTAGPRVILYSRAGCHLCVAGRDAVQRVADATGADWLEVDVDTQPAARAQYGDFVPAVTVDGTLIDHWRIDERRLRRAVETGPAK